MIRMGIAAALMSAALFLTGCTERERAGYSAIPQNSPPSWRLQPYGNMQN